MYKIAICDDDEKMVNGIKNVLKKHLDAQNKDAIISTYLSGELLLRELKSKKIDLIYLDIQMNGLNGVQVGNYIRKKLKDNGIQIIFISAIKDYAMELFPIRPNDFLLKPFTNEQLINSYNMAISLGEEKRKKFKYCVNSRERLQDVENILYFEVCNHKIKMVTLKGEIEFYGKLKDISDDLRNEGFALCHNSFLINIEHIVEFGKTQIQMSNDEIIKISRGKKNEFLNQIAKFDMK